MKNTITLVLVAVAAITLCSSCAHVMTPFQAMPGVLFSEIYTPGFATAGPVGSASGMSSSESYVGLFARGDASIDAAVKQGGLTKITHVDYKAFSVLGVYARLETYVYGEK